MLVSTGTVGLGKNIANILAVVVIPRGAGPYLPVTDVGVHVTDRDSDI